MRRTGWKRAVPLLAVLAVVPVLFTMPVRSHCPLCSAGAGGAAGVASALGIGLEIVGVFLGAFGVATGLWMSQYVDKEYVPYQRQFLTLVIYLSFVLPVMPIMNEYSSIYISMAGEYGSALNRTYLVDHFLVGAFLGGVVVASTPHLSRIVSELRGRTIPFQGLTMTFVLLGVSAAILHVLL